MEVDTGVPQQQASPKLSCQLPWLEGNTRGVEEKEQQLLAANLEEQQGSLHDNT